MVLINQSSNGTGSADFIRRPTDAMSLTERSMAILAHELRNPLHAIALALAELQPTCDAEPVARTAREMAEMQVQQMSRIIDKVLDLARLRRNPSPIRKERVCLAATVSTAVYATRPIMIARRHRLKVLLPDDPVTLDAQPSRLVQILSNLLTNAANYTPPSGDISVVAESSAEWVTLRVRDNGIGIPPDLLPHIFDAYRRDLLHPCNDGGLGIGLALVKSIVESHGGSVAAHSTGPGQGSEFIVRLPCSVEGNRSPAVGWM